MVVAAITLDRAAGGRTTTLVSVATMLDAAQMRLVPIVCGFFVLVRLVYWWGYLRAGTLGRAPGVQMTFALNVPLLVLVAVLLVRSLLAGRA